MGLSKHGSPARNLHSSVVLQESSSRMNSGAQNGSLRLSQSNFTMFKKGAKRADLSSKSKLEVMNELSELFQSVDETIKGLDVLFKHKSSQPELKPYESEVDGLVLIPGISGVPLGELIEVHINGAMEYDLVGEPLIAETFSSRR